MELSAFHKSLSKSEPPSELDLALKALWWDAKGDWNKAHDFAQKEENKRTNWVHAYLHRKEGDASNAGYWYGRVHKSLPSHSLEMEWEEISSALLAGKD